MFGLSARAAVTVRAAAAGLAAMTMLAACGGGSSSNAASSDGGSGSAVVRTQSGHLVDGKGMSLYFADQDKAGDIKCTDTCLSFWFPVTAKGGNVHGVAGLATVKRPDTGATQVTLDGKPLYTFKLDSSGSTKGDGFSDDFGGTSFNWHLATVGKTSPSTGGDSGVGGGYGGGGY